MQGWMIALIVIASVIFVIVAAFFIGSFIAVSKVLGRRKPHKPSPELQKKYGLDMTWYDEVRDLMETVSIVSYDGLTLRSYLIKHAEPTSKVAICHHGYGDKPLSMQPQAKIFYDMGYDVLLPAARAHDISDGKYIGMAWLDRFDMLRWVDKMVDLYGSGVSIALLGVSMGGSTVIAASGMTPPPQVKCVIDDCGFSSQREEYYACLKKVPLPKAFALLPLTIGVRLKLGYSISDADISALAAKADIPVLFIHGENDDFVPYELGKKMYDVCGSADKEFYSVKDAGHALCYATDPDSYRDRVSAFCDKYM